jgi:hypothetical protein
LRLQRFFPPSFAFLTPRKAFATSELDPYCNKSAFLGLGFIFDAFFTREHASPTNESIRDCIDFVGFINCTRDFTEAKSCE